MIGQRLAHYRVTAALGAGGMGEVYRATDTKLNREVAIKVLPPEVAGDPERLARFQREAQLLAALNHPNIAAIHGLEEAEGRLFLVLELVEGEDVRERLARGAIPVDEALGIARQIAEALEEAHEKGIVHRDLKPANVKLTPEGKAKVLDFGLAKAWTGDGGEGGSPSASMSQSPTLAQSGTQAGVILGTAAYMSPEQARGKAVDKRGDVWAFGVLLWEMLTGHALFNGDAVTEILASVMRDDPDWSKLPGSTPHSARRLLRRCLKKNPRERLHDIADARLELEDVLAGTADDIEAVEPGHAESAPVGRRRNARQKWVWAAAGILGGLLVASIFAGRAKVPEVRPAVRFVLETPEGFGSGPFATSNAFARDIPAVSPDGRHVAFSGFFKGASHLWIRSLDTAETRRVPGTVGAGLPFWSPDGTWIAFATVSELRKVRIAGGRVRRICATPGGRLPGGATWGKDGTIVFAHQGGHLFAVAEGGGDARPLTALDESRAETGHWWPRFLDGDRFLFTIESPEGTTEGLYAATLAAPHERRRVVAGGARVTYSSGRLLFAQGATLFAQPFDAERLEASGEPSPVVSNLNPWRPRPDWGAFGVSPGEVLVYRERGVDHVQLLWVGRRGERLGTLGEPGEYGQIALSQDGRRVALERGGDIWVMDVSRGVASRVTTDPVYETDPVWSPDGQDLAFASVGASDVSLLRKGIGGGESTASLIERGSNWPEHWSRDGTTLLYNVGGDAVWALPLGGGAPPELVLETGFQLDEPQLSPDGRWLAYISTESGDWEVYVQPFRQPGERFRVSKGGGGQPKWMGKGGELFFRSAGGALMAVEVGTLDGELEVGEPTELFQVGLTLRPQVDGYAVDADGQRFLVKVPVGARGDDRFHVVVNWPSLLEEP